MNISKENHEKPAKSSLIRHYIRQDLRHPHSCPRIQNSRKILDNLDAAILKSLHPIFS